MTIEIARQLHAGVGKQAPAAAIDSDADKANAAGQTWVASWRFCPN